MSDSSTSSLNEGTTFQNDNAIASSSERDSPAPNHNPRKRNVCATNLPVDRPLEIAKYLKTTETILKQDKSRSFPEEVLNQINVYQESLMAHDVRERMDFLVEKLGRVEPPRNNEMTEHKMFVEETVRYLRVDAFFQDASLVEYCLERFYRAARRRWDATSWKVFAFEKLLPVLLDILRHHREALRSQSCLLLLALSGRWSYCPRGLIVSYNPLYVTESGTYQWTAGCVDSIMEANGLETLSPQRDGGSYKPPSSWSANAIDYTCKLLFILYKSLDERPEAPFHGVHHQIRGIYNSLRGAETGYPTLHESTRGIDLSYGVITLGEHLE